MTDSANLELVRSIYADWERGDYRSGEWAHPEIEVVFADGPSPGRWTGVTAMAETYREFPSAWEGYRSAASQHREIDDETILTLATISGRGKMSGADVANQVANLFRIRDGKVTRLVIYWDRDRAFADLGLAPEGGS